MHAPTGAVEPVSAPADKSSISNAKIRAKNDRIPLSNYRVDEYVSYGRRFAKQNFGRPYRCGGNRFRARGQIIRLKNKKSGCLIKTAPINLKN